MSFSDTMETSDFVIRAWDDRLNSRDTIVYEAIEVLDSVSEFPGFTEGGSESESSQSETEFQGVIVEDSGVEQLTADEIENRKQIILQWAGYKEFSLTDEELLDRLNVQGEFLPLWVKENFGIWVYKGQVESDEIVQAIKYLEKIGITI